MVDYAAIESVFADQGGLLHIDALTRLGLNPRDVNALINTGRLARVKRGVYEWVENRSLSDLELISKLIPDGVLCLHSALYCHGYTDRTPSEWEVAVDRRTNRKRFNLTYPDVRVHYSEANLLGIGITQEECLGAVVRIYDKERTICDVFRFMRQFEREVFNKAIVAYVKDSSKNIHNLVTYSKQLRVFSRLQEVIGPWL